jgi:hypothetical protein
VGVWFRERHASTVRGYSAICEIVWYGCHRTTVRLKHATWHDQWRTEGGGGFKPPHPKFRSFAKAEPNSQFRGIYIRNSLIRIRVSFIYKLSGAPGLGATVPRSPFCLPSILNWICCPPPQRKKSLGTPLAMMFGLFWPTGRSSGGLYWIFTVNLTVPHKMRDFLASWAGADALKLLWFVEGLGNLCVEIRGTNK